MRATSYTGGSLMAAEMHLPFFTLSNYGKELIIGFNINNGFGKGIEMEKKERFIVIIDYF